MEGGEEGEIRDYTYAHSTGNNLISGAFCYAVQQLLM